MASIYLGPTPYNEIGIDYALKLDDNCPANWDEQAKLELGL